MEYCGKLGDNGISRKALTKTLASFTAVIFTMAGACELPALDYTEVSMSRKAYYDNEMVIRYQNGEETFDAMKAKDILMGGISDAGMQKKSLEDIARESENINRNLGNALSCAENGGTLSDDSLFIWSGDVQESSVTDWTLPENSKAEYSKIHGLPEITEGQPPMGNTIPNPPTNHQLPEMSGEESAPTPPKEEISATPPADNNAVNPPPENIVPNTPETEVPGDTAIPDIPNTDEGAGAPGDTGTTDTPSDGGGADAVPMPGFQINADGMIYGVIYEEGLVDADGCLELPTQGCSGILKGAFDKIDAGICEIIIPPNITFIDNGALADLPELSWIDAMEGNPNYSSVDGVLFDSSQSTIMAFPAGRIGTYNVPEFVERFAEDSFTNVNIEKLDMRTCGLVEAGPGIFGGNGGNGLVIFAPKAYLEGYQIIFGDMDVIVE